jgi:hypothetical protein
MDAPGEYGTRQSIVNDYSREEGGCWAWFKVQGSVLAFGVQGSAVGMFHVEHQGEGSSPPRGYVTSCNRFSTVTVAESVSSCVPDIS